MGRLMRAGTGISGAGAVWATMRAATTPIPRQADRQ